MELTFTKRYYSVASDIIFYQYSAYIIKLKKKEQKLFLNPTDCKHIKIKNTGYITKISKKDSPKVHDAGVRKQWQIKNIGRKNYSSKVWNEYLKNANGATITFMFDVSALFTK